MPGKQVKNWRQYHGLRKQGFSKSSAARITNAASSKAKAKGKRKRKGQPKRGAGGKFTGWSRG